MARERVALLETEAAYIETRIDIGERTHSLNKATPYLDSLLKGQPAPRQLKGNKMTFEEWWDEFEETIDWLDGAISADRQPSFIRKLFFKDAYLEGYEAGYEAHKEENKCISKQPTAEHSK